MNQPTHHHMAAVKRIIRYLLETQECEIFFPATSNLNLNAYCDADWASYPDTPRLTTGWCVFLGDAPISWKCEKHESFKILLPKRNITLSSACSEVVLIRRFLDEPGFPQRHATPLQANNTSAIVIAENPVFDERTKPIEVKCH